MTQTTAYAVFEILNADTPVQWMADGRSLFVRASSDAKEGGVLMSGIRLPDQSIAVRRFTLGSSLGALAQERASRLPDGRVVTVTADSWPTAEQCFDALLADVEARNEPQHLLDAIENSEADEAAQGVQAAPVPA